jgi:PHD/YefM family antitoxin component YafN of YafNO toxin-antitoxin module
MERTKHKPDFIYRGNKPVAAILKIHDYEKMLEDLEDIEDIRYLKEIRKTNVQTFEFDDYLAARGVNV